MSQPFLAEIRIFTGNFAPRGWAFCQGQILSIAQNTALFSLLGTTYGGNGQTTFALPNLAGRVPVGTGTGPGLSTKTLGEAAGAETVTLLATQMPAHTHQLRGSSGAPTTNSPSNALLPTATSRVYNTGSADTGMNAAAVAIQGGSQPHENMQPYLAVNYIIATQGIYPSRN